MEKIAQAIEPAMEIDKASIRQYIRAVHMDDVDKRGFIIWAEKRKNGGWKQWGYLLDELLRYIRKMGFDVEKNLYLSLQTFCAPFRRAETLFRLNAIGYDIDFHDGRIKEAAIVNVFHENHGEVF
jgi:hypothetical protein